MRFAKIFEMEIKYGSKLDQRETPNQCSILKCYIWDSTYFWNSKLGFWPRFYAITQPETSLQLAEHAHFPSGGGFDMMGSAIVAMAITDSFGKHVVSNVQSLTLSQSSHLWSQSPPSPLPGMSNPSPQEGACSSSCHNKSAPPKLPAVTLKNMKTSWSCQWQLLASNLVQKLPCSLNCNQFPGVTSHVPKVPTVLRMFCFTLFGVLQ